MNNIKRIIWKFLYIIYPSLRDFILFTHLWKHIGRQDFSIGYKKKNINLEHVKNILKNHGFEHSICSWIDDGEVLSMRKQANGKYQYHLRLYSDGELRGHYEYSPEGAPIKHLLGYNLKPEQRFFKYILNTTLIK